MGAYDEAMHASAGKYAFSSLSLLFAAFFTLGAPFLVESAELRTGDQPSVSSSEVVVEDIYIAGGNVSSSGNLRADLVAAGGNVLVNNLVAGDVNLAGGAVTILSDVGDDVRALGGNILIQGSVGGDVVFGAGQVVLGGSGVGGDVLGAGGTIRIDAPISGDVRLAGGDIHLNSSISGDVEIFVEQLTLGESARISGNLTYTAGKEISEEARAAISGEVIFDKRERAISVGGIVAVLSFALISTFLAQFASGLLFGLAFRRFAVRMVENASERPLFETGRGLVVFIVLPIASILLLSSIIGVPLGLLGLFTSAALIVYLWIVTPVLLGSFAYRSFFGGEFEVNWKTILLGVFIYTLLGIIPIAGWLVQIILILLTLGTTVKVKWDIVKEWQ